LKRENGGRKHATIARLVLQESYKTGSPTSLRRENKDKRKKKKEYNPTTGVINKGGTV